MLGETSGGDFAMTTTGGGTTANTLYYYTPPHAYWWYPYQPPYTFTPIEPTTCIGKAHVFECDHVDTCKCGAIVRKVAKKHGR